MVNEIPMKSGFAVFCLYPVGCPREEEEDRAMVFVSWFETKNEALNYIKDTDIGRGITKGLLTILETYGG